jgi:hypothetical protein
MSLLQLNIKKTFDIINHIKLLNILRNTGFLI